MTNEEGVIWLVSIVAVALFFLAVVFAGYNIAQKNNEKSAAIQIACIDKGGVWNETSNACTWSK